MSILNIDPNASLPPCDQPQFAHETNRKINIINLTAIKNINKQNAIIVCSSLIATFAIAYFGVNSGLLPVIFGNVKADMCAWLSFQLGMIYSLASSPFLNIN